MIKKEKEIRVLVFREEEVRYGQLEVVRTAKVEYAKEGKTGAWKFDICEFSLENQSHYTYEDWLFLGNVSNLIQAHLVKLNNEDKDDQ